MREKTTFLSIFAALAATLIILPFVVSFNQVLTDLVEKFVLYSWVQDQIVPVQTRLVGVLVAPFRVTYVAYLNGMIVNGLPMEMTWNCLGWQSLLLFGVSAIFGLRGQYSNFSKIEAIISGLLGIFWINLLRITATVLLAAAAPAIFRVVFHDYLAALTTIAFLFGFWWFAYAFILVERQNSV